MSATLHNVLDSADRLSRRINALERTQRHESQGPPFDRTPARRPLSPEQQFQAREAEANRLTEVIERDITGRQISRFYGDPEVCWGAFKLPGRRISRVNTGAK